MVAQNQPQKDSLGRLFDPRKFRQKFDAVGRWVNARAGRKSKRNPMSNTATETAAPAAETPTATPAAETPSTGLPDFTTPDDTRGAAPAGPDLSDIAAAAKAPATVEGLESDIETARVGSPTAETVIGIIQTGFILIGEDEGILSASEKTLLRLPLERILKKYNIGADVLPPEVDLIFAVLGLLVARLKKPKTATTFAKARSWVLSKWFGHKGEVLRRTVIRETAAS